MDDGEWQLTLWVVFSLMTEGLGPISEWDPTDPRVFRARHSSFWETVHDIVPDDEDDEPFWMTQAASTKLAHN